MSVSGELREMLPAWAVLVLLPVPVATLWPDGTARDFAYAYLFLGCAILTADRFARPGARTPDAWRARTAALALAGAGMAGVFTAFVTAVTGEPNAVVPFLATLAVLTALACVPFPAVATGQPYLAVLFAVVLLAGIKLAGCVVVVLIHGWDSQEQGRLTLPWENPNLLVWLCFAGVLTCSAVLFLLGRGAFLKGSVPQAGAA